MNTIRTALLITLSLLGLTALSDHNHNGSANNNGSAHIDGHHNHAITHTVSAHDHDGREHEAEHEAVNAVAHADLEAHGLLHFGPGVLHDETYGELVHWIDDWELRWINYEVDGHTVTLYHATTHDHTHRCTSHWDEAGAHYTNWDCAH